MFARFFNIFIATWVLVAAFAFDNPMPQFISMVVVAVLVMAFEALAFFSNSVRLVNTGLGLWLLLSGFVLPTTTDFILWNNFLCGVGIAVLSLVRTRLHAGPWIPAARRDAEAS